MEDTSRENRQLVYDIIMAKSVEERFLMCAELYENAREFAKIGMPDGLIADEQEVFLFRRLHGLRPDEMV